MAKNFFQDMVKMKNDNRAKLVEKFDEPVEKFSPPAETPYKRTPAMETRQPIEENKIQPVRQVRQAEPEPNENEYEEDHEADTKFASVYDISEQSSGGRSRRGIWYVAGASIIFLIFAVSLLFAGAKITANPKIQAITLNNNFTAVKDAAEGDATTIGVLPFDLVAVPGTETKNIAGGHEEDVAIKATGSVFIYNNYSTATQNLDIDTRLEGSNGKIYKTKNKVTVPGMKGSTPGKVQVSIYGTESGPAYNSKPLDFKIFGFKGTSKYTKFYARSVGDITGGFNGKSMVVSAADKEAAFGELEATLKAKLLVQATGQIPSGFILFKDAIFLNIDSKTTDSAPGEAGTIPVTVKGTLYGILFDESKLTDKIVQAALPSYDQSQGMVYIPKVRDLVFSLSNKDNVSFADIKNISFSLKGDASIVSRIDEAKLVGDMLGKKKKDFKQLLSQYPSIDSAELSLRPFWKMSIPKQQEDVKVIINYPE